MVGSFKAAREREPTGSDSGSVITRFHGENSWKRNMMMSSRYSVEPASRLIVRERLKDMNSEFIVIYIMF